MNYQIFYRYENIFIYIKIQLCTFCGCYNNFKVSQLIILLIVALPASYILYNHFVNLLRSKSHSNPKSKIQANVREIKGGGES